MILDNLQTASFRGVTFLIGDSSTDGGRKTITHEYPNTDRRVVEDIGLLQDTFSLTGIVVTQEDFTDRDDLKDALTQAGPGELVHPFFGTVTVVAKPFNVVENTSELGIARFTMLFERSQDPIFPTQAAVKTSLIKSQSDIVIASVAENIGEEFSVLDNIKSNYQSALTQLQSVGDRFNEIGRTVSAVTNFISSFSATVTSFVDNIVSNIFSPALLADSITDMFLQFDTLAPNALGQFELAKQLFGFGSDDPIIEPTTVGREQKASNQAILNSAIRANAIALAFNNAANIDYENELEVTGVRQALEEEYQSIILSTNLSSGTLGEPQNLSSDPSLSNDTIEALQELRNTSRLFFDDVSISVSKIRNITVNPIPMSILSYQYYGNTDETEDLINLNNIADVSIVSGELQILTP
jgi:prophage DNA circulation protein